MARGHHRTVRQPGVTPPRQQAPASVKLICFKQLKRSSFLACIYVHIHMCVGVGLWICDVFGPAICVVLINSHSLNCTTLVLVSTVGLLTAERIVTRCTLEGGANVSEENVTSEKLISISTSTRVSQPRKPQSEHLQPSQSHNLQRDLHVNNNSVAKSASELYRPSDRRLSEKLVPTFADRRCHVFSVTDPYGRILRTYTLCQFNLWHLPNLQLLSYVFTLFPFQKLSDVISIQRTSCQFRDTGRYYFEVRYP
jgi:hypothetical protein